MAVPRQENVIETIKRRYLEVTTKEPELKKIQLDEQLHETIYSPEMTLEWIIYNVFQRYGNRDALAERDYIIKHDDQSQKSVRQFLPKFNTISYHKLHQRIKRLANIWRSNDRVQLQPGDLACLVGTTGIDHVTVEFSLVYNQIGIVPIDFANNERDLMHVIAQIKPKLIVIGAKHLNLIDTIARRIVDTKLILVVNYDESVTDESMCFQDATLWCNQSPSPKQLISIEQLLAEEENEQWDFLPPTPEGSQRIAKIIFTSGSTGVPKGVIFNQKQEIQIWQIKYYNFPDITLFIAPFNHILGNAVLISTLVRGGVGFFPSKRDLSMIFEDISLVRPTFLCVFPRIFEFIFEYYQQQVQRRLSAEPNNRQMIEQEVKQELGTSFLGDRLIIVETSGAPVSSEVKSFITDCFDAGFLFSYGMTESAGILISSDRLSRRFVSDYKLNDVPELGYRVTDKPYPRGELWVKNVYDERQYYNEGNAFDKIVDADGYIHTGDIVEDRGSDCLIIIDRLKNVIKLSQGEFVALGQLATLFETQSRFIKQVYVYGDSHYAYLLAVIVPNVEMVEQKLGRDWEEQSLKKLLQLELQRIAQQNNLKAHEIPRDFIIELESFSVDNGLLSSLHKRLISALLKKYQQRLNTLYHELQQISVQGRVGDGTIHSRQDVQDELIHLLQINLKRQVNNAEYALTYAQLGGDSLDAVGLAMAIKNRFGIPFPVDSLFSPEGCITLWTNIIFMALKDLKKQSVSFEAIHGVNKKILHASELSLEHFLESDLLKNAQRLPYTKSMKTVFLTGANGFLGRFICLDWLRKLKAQGGTLICLIRAQNDEKARQRLDDVFLGADEALKREYQALKENTLVVMAGDVSKHHFAISEDDYRWLCQSVDRIVHAAALVSHLLSYESLFSSNVVGTAEVIRLGLTHTRKPIDYISSVAIKPYLEDRFKLNEDSALKTEICLREGYAIGYAASKWASEQLLMRSFEQFGLPINIFRNNMMLPHQQYHGQINTNDFFTRLLYSIIVTGLAPQSFYSSNHHVVSYDGIPVDIAASCIVSVGDMYHQHYTTYMMQNYHHSNSFSLDSIVELLIENGYSIKIIPDYQQWFNLFKDALHNLAQSKQKKSVILLLDALKNTFSNKSTVVGCDNFIHLLHTMSPSMDLPKLGRAYILKCINDLKQSL